MKKHNPVGKPDMAQWLYDQLKIHTNTDSVHGRAVYNRLAWNLHGGLILILQEALREQS